MEIDLYSFASGKTGPSTVELEQSEIGEMIGMELIKMVGAEWAVPIEVVPKMTDHSASVSNIRNTKPSLYADPNPYEKWTNLSTHSAMH